MFTAQTIDLGAPVTQATLTEAVELLDKETCSFCTSLEGVSLDTAADGTDFFEKYANADSLLSDADFDIGAAGAALAAGAAATLGPIAIRAAKSPEVMEQLAELLPSFGGGE